MKYLICKLEPARFRSYIERAIESKEKLNFQTRAGLFPLISEILTQVDFWKDQMDKGSSNNDRKLENRNFNRKKLECFNCKGEHKAKCCPWKSMEYPIKNVRRF